MKNEVYYLAVREKELIMSNHALERVKERFGVSDLGMRAFLRKLEPSLRKPDTIVGFNKKYKLSKDKAGAGIVVSEKYQAVVTYSVTNPVVTTIYPLEPKDTSNKVKHKTQMEVLIRENSVLRKESAKFLLQIDKLKEYKIKYKKLVKAIEGAL